MASPKDKKVQVRLTTQMYEQFQAYCEEEGIGMSEFLRDVVKDILKNKQNGV
jgi:metal-responsive CopG/Arc/MetJ family transcriptional regulator